MSATPTKSLENVNLLWDLGTAYELFISLMVLHEPDFYRIRASWAAGIRSRIPAAERKLLEEVSPFLGVPLKWIYELPSPKDGVSVLWAMKQIPAGERMASVFGIADCEKEMCKLFQQIAERRAYTEDDLDLFLSQLKTHNKKSTNREEARRYLAWWATPEEFGERFLNALQAYHQAFFEEEEKRIRPILQAGLEQAKELSEKLGIIDLLTELSQGVRFEEEIQAKEIIIAPAFWTTPLIMFDKISEDQMLFLFGARPADISAIPGEAVPDGLVRTLKALADPTRLKILFYISHEELSPSEIARRLHLRAPTVTHHLNELRMSGLVQLTIEPDEKRYTVRTQALEATFSNLMNFLQSDFIEE